MCAAPTWGADPPDGAALARAGWRDEELTWEQVQVAAAEALAAGQAEEAAQFWLIGLELARDTFGGDDLRLGTSLANHGVGQRRAGKSDESEALFAEALAIWRSRERWIDGLTPNRRARSSLYHLRLERGYPGAYDEKARARYRALAEEGLEALEALANGTGAPRGALARWQKLRPVGYDDGRKLLAAVLLLAD